MRKIYYNPEGSDYEQSVRADSDPNFAKWLVVDKENPHVLRAYSDFAEVAKEVHE